MKYTDSWLQDPGLSGCPGETEPFALHLCESAFRNWFAVQDSRCSPCHVECRHPSYSLRELIQPGVIISVIFGPLHVSDRGVLRSSQDWVTHTSTLLFWLETQVSIWNTFFWNQNSSQACRSFLGSCIKSLGGAAEGRAGTIASCVSVENNCASYSQPCRTTAVDILILSTNLSLTLTGFFPFPSYHFPPPPSLFSPLLCF